MASFPFLTLASLGLNSYQARTDTVKKDKKKGVHHEVAAMSFVVDVSKSVRFPAYSLGTREHVFSDSEFRERLQDLGRQVDTHMRGEEWAQALSECEEAARHVSYNALYRDLSHDFFTTHQLSWRFFYPNGAAPQDWLVSRIQSVFIDGFAVDENDVWPAGKVVERVRNAKVLALAVDGDNEIQGYAIYTIAPKPFNGRDLLWEDSICLTRRWQGRRFSNSPVAEIQTQFRRSNIGWVGGCTQNPLILRRYKRSSLLYPFDRSFVDREGERLFEFLCKNVPQIAKRTEELTDAERSEVAKTGILRGIYKQQLGSYPEHVDGLEDIVGYLESNNFDRNNGDVVVAVSAVDKADL
ncbi:MAG: hypothetical protein GY711_21690 [bacterium]|nr:hypothetical protein [bacterium]